ncbi:hypothetical protein AB9P05_01360 [Roseivirga sp. BDSF3-8]|uniref:hypothetical protein n=1 Tax=Roseivirga sp. BDSF3-8 TaxID=3241598 RepID=UPI0035326116
MRKHLTYYAGLRYEMLRIGYPTTGQVRHVWLEGERIEGAARYIETFTAEATFFPTVNDDPTHSYSEALTNPTHFGAIDYALFNRSRYHIGAIVTHFLIKLGVDVEATYRAGITPYEATLKLLESDDTDLANVAIEARSALDYEHY